MTIPNRAIEKKNPDSDGNGSDNNNQNSSPLLSRRQKLHGFHAASDVLPKFSISMEDSRPTHRHSTSSLGHRSLEGPKSLPVTPKVSVEPNTPSPLVICSRNVDHHGGAKPKMQMSPLSSSSAGSSAKMVKSSSATGLSLMIPNPEDSPISVQSPGGSSTASSRDASPCRWVFFLPYYFVVCDREIAPAVLYVCFCGHDIPFLYHYKATDWFDNFSLKVIF